MKVELVEYSGSDLTTVNSARVSFDKKSRWEVKEDDSYDLSEKDQKLIKYLAKEGHTSPFGHCFATFHCKAPIFVHRQLIKHAYLRCNEVSRRYVESEPEFYVPEVWRGRAKDKKQGSEGEVSTYNTKVLSLWHDDALGYYQKLLADGVAPEMARMVLPLSTYTEWYWSGSMDAFANMCNLRCKPDAQYETRVFAEQIDKLASELWPHSWKALRNAD